MTHPAGALAVVQARMSSTRLPGKVLADVGGDSVLALMLQRLGASGAIARTVVATSDRPDDDAVADAAAQLGVGVHRGPLDDVLARFAGAARGHDGPVIRLTADCPLIDPALVDDLVGRLGGDPSLRYVHNVWPRTFPDGLDVEVLAGGVLAELDAAAREPGDREHVTTPLRRDPERWPQLAVEHEPALGDVRWTLDTPDDLTFVRGLVERLGAARYDAPWGDVLEVVRSAPALLAIPGGRRG